MFRFVVYIVSSALFFDKEKIEQLRERNYKIDKKVISVSSQSLDSLFEKALKENCAPTSALSLLNEYHNVAIFSTGINPLDDILKGGIYSSELTERGGHSGSGKTSFCIKLGSHLLTR